MKQNLKFTLLSVACLSGLVSCYPVTPMNPHGPAPVPSGLKTPAEIDAAAKKKAAAANSQKTALQRSKERLEREERNRLNAEKREAAAYRKKVAESTNPSTPEITKPKPLVVKPKVVKFAAPVPGKAGFVYNPYTKNQVDVRGIPSGTKVRDPHDSNPAHIFKVP